MREMKRQKKQKQLAEKRVLQEKIAMMNKEKSILLKEEQAKLEVCDNFG